MEQQPEVTYTSTNSIRPYMEVVREQAAHIHPYPQRLVEQFELLARAQFVPDNLRATFLHRVNNDEGYMGLLSQPSVIFDMVAYLFLKGHERVLEGGTGTGYQTAILARLCQHVTTIEQDSVRLEAAQQRLINLGITNVTYICGDAAGGYPQGAPYDRMIFGAAMYGEQVDQHLTDQMAQRCRLMIPTGTYDSKRERVIGDLLQVDKKDGQVTQKINPLYKGTLFFIPLVSPHSIGWTFEKGTYVPSVTRTQRRKSWTRSSLMTLLGARKQ